MARVNYDAVARTYQSGRGERAQVEACRKAVAGHLPARPNGLRVLDLGAGTGIFARVWPEWGAARVIALDLARGMLAESRRIGLPAVTQPVVGRGEALPLRSASQDVAWISTVFHHLKDPAACIADLRRVLVPDGVVFLRAMYSDLDSAPGWYDVFPGGQRAYQRFTRLADLTRQFEAGGFRAHGIEKLSQATALASEVDDWVRRMRHADSFLVALTDDEVDAGLAALADVPPYTTFGRGALHIAVFRAP